MSPHPTKGSEQDPLHPRTQQLPEQITALRVDTTKQHTPQPLNDHTEPSHVTTKTPIDISNLLIKYSSNSNTKILLTLCMPQAHVFNR